MWVPRTPLAKLKKNLLKINKIIIIFFFSEFDLLLIILYGFMFDVNILISDYLSFKSIKWSEWMDIHATSNRLWRKCNQYHNKPLYKGFDKIQKRKKKFFLNIFFKEIKKKKKKIFMGNNNTHWKKICTFQWVIRVWIIRVYSGANLHIFYQH